MAFSNSQPLGDAEICNARYVGVPNISESVATQNIHKCIHIHVFTYNYFEIHTKYTEIINKYY